VRAIKGSLPLRQGEEIHSPLSPREFLELFAHPFVTFVHIQYQTARHRAITSREGCHTLVLRTELKTPYVCPR
jgi:hypothetical protein